jgi:hypothetical protein
MHAHPTLDRVVQGADLPHMPQRGWLAIFALLLTAAAPPADDVQQQVQQVQQVPLDQTLAILGHPVADPEGKNIGRLVDVLVGDQNRPQAAVIDFGGFLGVGNRKIAVEWSALHFAPNDPKHPITLDLTQDQIKDAPEYKEAIKPAPVVVAPEAPK